MPAVTLVSLAEASKWASEHLAKAVSPTNISYLVQYGKLKKHGKNGSVFVDLGELKQYYESLQGSLEHTWKKKLGDDLNWALSFDNLREKDTTKHVHRLHSYKGKFIPQLVEYFIDEHVDGFKKKSFFKPGDVILDPFSGSGTALVQAGETGLHSIGIDVSRFNCLISEVKLQDYDFFALQQEINRIQYAISECDSRLIEFETELMQKLFEFNGQHFPGAEYRRRLHCKELDEDSYAAEKDKEFLKTYRQLVKKYKVKLCNASADNFLDKWYCRNVRNEMDIAFRLISEIKDEKNKKAMLVVLSRTIRSCRATTHYDLATLKEPQFATYYCWKHKKICKPLYSIKHWFNRYSKDTLARILEYKQARKAAYSVVLPADSRSVHIMADIEKQNRKFHKLLAKKKIRGIFTSPPYVGQIDYHEQHAYAYDLFGFERKDELEIGPLYKGQGAQARDSYVAGIADVLNNCKKFLCQDHDTFIVANDKFDLYPQIAERSGMKIVQRFKRPVLNRTERDRNPYAEIIFHFRSR